MLQSRSISGRPLSGRVIDGRALGMRASGAGSASDSLRPLAPVLTWVSDNTVNPPQLDADFDDTKVWSSELITGSNFDRIEAQIDQDPLFGSVDETDTNDLDAAELLAGTAQIFPGPLAFGVALYIRARHHHYVAGVPHTSAWSNIVAKTLVDATAPTITSSNAVSAAENATLSHALTANESVTWSIVGGADLTQFELSGSTLRWSSNGTRDYEVPADADTNNTYIVTVRATDLFSNTADQTITVTVTDVSDTAVAAPILPWMASSQPPFLRF